MNTLLVEIKTSKALPVRASSDGSEEHVFGNWRKEGLTWEMSQPIEIIKDAKIGDSLPGKALWRENQGHG